MKQRRVASWVACLGVLLACVAAAQSAPAPGDAPAPQGVWARLRSVLAPLGASAQSGRAKSERAQSERALAARAPKEKPGPAPKGQVVLPRGIMQAAPGRLTPLEAVDWRVGASGPGAAPSATPWAKPLAGGSLSILLILPRMASSDAAELERRFDCTIDLVATHDAHQLGLQAAAEDVEASQEAVSDRLRKGLDRHHEVIIIGGVDLSALSVDALDALASAIRAGAGLLLCRYDGEDSEASKRFLEALTPFEAHAGGAGGEQGQQEGTEAAPAPLASAVAYGLGEEATPEWKGGISFVTPYTLGEGRVVEMVYGPPRPKLSGLLPGFNAPLDAENEFTETYWSLVARAVRWCARREPPFRVQQVAFAGPAAANEEEIPPNMPIAHLQGMMEAQGHVAYRPYTVQLDAPADRAYSVRSRVRRPGRDTEAVIDYGPTLAPGAQSCTVYLFAGPGQSLLDLWILEKDKVVEWHTVVIDSEGWPAFENLRISKDAIRPNDSVEIAFRVRSALHKPRPVTAYARAKDALGRTVAEQYAEIPQTGASATLTLDLVDVLTPLVKIEAYLMDHERRQPSEWDLSMAAYWHAYLPVSVPFSSTQLHAVVEMDASAEPAARRAARTLRELGVEAVYTAGDQEALFYAAAGALRALPQWSSFAPIAATPASAGAPADAGAPGPGDPLTRNPCLADPAFREEESARLQASASMSLPYASHAYSLGAGNCVSPTADNVCQCAACLKGFREALEVQYGSIDELNAQWRTQFKAWEEVAPASEEVARGLGVYAPWLDFRRYMDTVFDDAHTFARDVVRRTDPDAVVGFVARPAPLAYSGHDWPRLAAHLDFLAAPASERNAEELRVARTSGALTALTPCAPMNEAQARWIPWNAVLHGSNLAWWGPAIGDDDSAPADSALAADGAPRPAFIAFMQEMQRLRIGAGDLVLASARPQSRIAVYSSRPAAYLEALLGDFDPAGTTTESVLRMLGALGYAADVVAPDNVLRGELDRFQVLILPMARALSNAEVAAIRAFSAAGGQILADVAPGQFDEHGLARPAPALDDIFGVARRAPVAPLAPANVAVRLAFGERAYEAELEALVPDGSATIQATSGATAGDTPVWILRKNDKALNLLVNHPLNASPAAASLLRAALAEMGQTPVVTPELKKGRMFEGECFSGQYGKARWVALLAAPTARKAQSFTLDLEAFGTVYDGVAGVRVLRPKRVPIQLAPGGVAFFVGLPYEVASLAVAAPEITAPGRRLEFLIQLKTIDALPGAHLVDIELAPSMGAPLTYYSRRIRCENGRAKGYIPLALNECPGAYILTARDALSGAIAQAFVTIAGPEPAQAKRTEVRKKPATP